MQAAALNPRPLLLHKKSDCLQLKNILFLTLKVFSATGGIEKVCRIAGKAMYENALRLNKRLMLMSMHDKLEDSFDNPYFPSEIFRGCGARKIQFVVKAVQEGMGADVVVLSHINLLLVGWLIKKISPATKVILFCHGIEVWQQLPFFKRRMLQCIDEFECVSKYTAEKIISVQGISPAKCKLLNNCLDPFLPLPKNVDLKTTPYKQYGFKNGDTILFTLTRLASTERYKGYDKVLEALSAINRPHVKYLVAGSYDEAEKKFLDDKVISLGLQNQVITAGFVSEADLAAYFMMSDIYVMPSSKEGFGIVFIEAMFYGLPVIAGNADGSVDALLNGALGQLVDPRSAVEIKHALEKILENTKQFKPDEARLMQNFGYDAYKMRINDMLLRVSA